MTSISYVIKILLFIVTILNVISCVHRINYDISPLHYKEPTRYIDNVDVALVLGGGGAKGFAHLGVIEVLEKNNIPIDLIVGTSAGSIVGALYADNPNIRYLKNKFFAVSKSEMLDFNFFSAIYGSVQGNYLRDFLDKNMKHKDIEDLGKPFIAVATSLETNKSFVFRTGPVIPAVHASSALPSIFTPVYIYGQHLIDGGATEPVPVETAKRFNPKIIIAVNISSPPDTTKDYNNVSIIGGYNAIGLAYHAFNISYYQLAQCQASLADISIHPDLKGFGILDDNRKLEMYNKGKEAAIKALPKILRKLQKISEKS